MVAAIRVSRLVFVPGRGKSALKTGGIVGPREEVLVTVVALSDVLTLHMIFNRLSP